ncbi:ATPase, T2SS/T4P/T4SS family [Sulfurospirillum arcachonense]|uniref:ATPase, T2SS/T4P/T4SS family n=1 Tax=Sulfurospirillum arcachonense TaxID=57666 RepID=UPI0004687FDD|nr:ATPase, T2SS/T4P/T4SS family [Sulfurospirillum arcachonense]
MSLTNNPHLKSKVFVNVLSKFAKYLEIENVNEIIINQPGTIYIDKLGKYEAIQDDNLTEDLLNSFATQLANTRETQFNRKNPRLFTSIPGTNYRVTLVHSSILSGQSIQINIRIPNTTIFELEKFIISKELGTDITYAFLKSLVAQKKNVLISGGTGSGKTSLLNSLLQEMDISDRVVTIEDSPEIIVSNPNKTQLLVSKTENGIFTYEDGVDAANRLSPDRLFMGELDVRNTMPFLRLNNTGHTGSISTLHANSTEDAINAMKANAMLGHKIHDKEALNSFICSAIDYIIQIRKDRKKNERIITEVLDLKKMKW